VVHRHCSPPGRVKGHRPSEPHPTFDRQVATKQRTSSFACTALTLLPLPHPVERAGSLLQYVHHLTHHHRRPPVTGRSHRLRQEDKTTRPARSAHLPLPAKCRFRPCWRCTSSTAATLSPTHLTQNSSPKRDPAPPRTSSLVLCDAAHTAPAYPLPVSRGLFQHPAIVVAQAQSPLSHCVKRARISRPQHHTNAGSRLVEPAPPTDPCQVHIALTQPPPALLSGECTFLPSTARLRHREPKVDCMNGLRTGLWQHARVRALQSSCMAYA
jgi:hypothetical protein